MDELEVLRKENGVLRKKLSKAIRIFKKIKKLMEKYKSAKRGIQQVYRPERVC